MCDEQISEKYQISRTAHLAAEGIPLASPHVGKYALIARATDAYGGFEQHTYGLFLSFRAPGGDVGARDSTLKRLPK